MDITQQFPGLFRNAISRCQIIRSKFTIIKIIPGTLKKFILGIDKKGAEQKKIKKLVTHIMVYLFVP
jgi:hypothetical protein